MCQGHKTPHASRQNVNLMGVRAESESASETGGEGAKASSGAEEALEGGTGPSSEHQLCEVGTFAQVHTIVPIDPKRAQLLLLGHRRIRRTKQVTDCQASAMNLLLFVVIHIPLKVSAAAAL